MFTRTTHRTFGRFFKIMQEEIWKDVPGYEGLYQVSNLGNIKGLHRRCYGRILSPAKNSKGYRYVGYIPTEMNSHGVISAIDLIFEKES